MTRDPFTLSPISHEEKKTIITSLTPNTHMQERGALAEASGQSRSQIVF